MQIQGLVGSREYQEIVRIGPRNITRMEGETDVFISCPYCLDDFNYPTWEVNGTVYFISNLPSQYLSAFGGLLIPIVTRALNNTSFRCYYPSPNSSFIPNESALGVLMVKRRLSNTGKHGVF